MQIERCLRCKGKGFYYGPGYMEKKCEQCHEVGYIEVKAVTPVKEVVEASGMEPITKKKRGRKKKGT